MPPQGIVLRSCQCLYILLVVSTLETIFSLILCQIFLLHQANTLSSNMLFHMFLDVIIRLSISIRHVLFS